MITKYGVYAVYDANLQAFMPDTVGVFLTDKQFVKAVAEVMAKDPDRDYSGYRFYHVFDFDVDLIPEKAKELTNDVNSCFNVLKIIPREVK